jgi:hypothetical protein
VRTRLQTVCLSLLGVAAAASLIQGLTRLLHPIGTQELVAIWTLAVALICAYPLLLRSRSQPTIPSGTVVVAAMGLLILSNAPTQALVVPICLLISLTALLTLPQLASLRAPLRVAIAGSVLHLAGELFWLSPDQAVREVSWWLVAGGGGLVFAGLLLAAGRPVDGRYRPVNAALALAGLGVAGGLMAESTWELIARVFVPFGDAYHGSAFPQDPRIPYASGTAYIVAAIGMLLLMRLTQHRRQPLAETAVPEPPSHAMRRLRADWTSEPGARRRPGHPPRPAWQNPTDGRDEPRR